MLRPNQLAILGLLAEGPAHAYAIHRQIRERRIQEWAPVGFSSVYQILRALERDGLVAGTDRPPEDGPGRREYRLTDVGRRALDETLAAVLGGRPTWRFVEELALMFRGSLGAAAVAELLASRREAVEAELRRVEGAADRAGPWASTARLILAHRAAHLRAEAEFLERARRELLAEAERAEAGGPTSPAGRP